MNKAELVNWSTAREGSTHCIVTPAGEIIFWLKKEGSDFYVYSAKQEEWLLTAERDFPGQWLVERPAPWSGEGLPPVGTVCEYAKASKLDPAPINTWKAGDEIKCVAYVEIKGIDPLPLFWNPRAFNASTLREDLYRPIRTPEQIAAEERERAIKEMWNCLVTTSSEEIRVQKQACAELYDAGYRKHDAQQLHELQGSSEIHQDNRELAEQRLRRLAEIHGKMAGFTLEDFLLGSTEADSLKAEMAEILSHYREPQA